MTDMSIALQEVKVRALKCAWDNACRKFDHYGTLPALLDMTDAMKALVAAEDELVIMKHDAAYAWHETMDVERV